jgi:ribose transport system permease protein
MTSDVHQSQAERAPAGIFSRIFRAREMSVLVALAALVVIMSLASPYFLEPQNIFNVLRNMSTISIVAIGMTMVIITGGIDLSVGSVLALSAMLTARVMVQFGADPWLALLVGLSVGALAGGTNGLIITKVQVNPFITTLGMMSVARGLTYLVASGVKSTVASNIPMRNEALGFLGAGYVGPVPFPVIEMVILVVLASLFLANTVLGRQIYGIGSNEQAARLSGVDVDRVRLFCYTLTGMLAAYAGVMTAGLLSTAATNAGIGMELDVIAAAVIGGASLAGGEGTVYGAVIGAAIMAVLRNAFVLLGLPVYLQTVSIGVVIVLAVALDRLRRRGQTA